MISPASTAAVTAARLRVAVRSATEVSALERSWAWVHVVQRAASAALARGGPTSRWATTRIRATSRSVITASA